jgi:hypothetical protein
LQTTNQLHLQQLDLQELPIAASNKGSYGENKELLTIDLKFVWLSTDI